MGYSRHHFQPAIVKYPSESVLADDRSIHCEMAAEIFCHKGQNGI
jgi:hypothetical protein